MKIKSIDLTAEAFAPFGQVMCGAADKTSFTQIGDGEEFSWTEVASGIDMDPVCCSGMLDCKSREKVVKKMEYHAKTAEILVGFENDYVLCVAPKKEGAPDMDKITAFNVKQGTVLVMERACWHWIPFPANEKNAKVLVIFRGKTGEDDLIFADLPEDVEIEA